jgi:hypothetical protein
MRVIPIIATVAALVLAVTPAFAGKGGTQGGGGRGGGGSGAQQSSASCSVNPNPASVGQSYVVSASGLPIGTAINLWVTDPSGNAVGSALGSTADGTANLTESSSSAGTWTYTFSGPSKNNPAAMAVYASCSVEAY